jgi:hypothetical protein
MGVGLLIAPAPWRLMICRQAVYWVGAQALLQGQQGVLHKLTIISCTIQLTVHFEQFREPNVTFLNTSRLLPTSFQQHSFLELGNVCWLFLCFEQRRLKVSPVPPM